MTSTIPMPSADGSAGDNLVEMAWDPITRIVGSLGIYTKVDFKNNQVVECHSTSSIFRGYSIFMRGKDPRDAHFITSRICGICGDNHATCSCLRAEHGLRREAARTSANGSSTWARPPSTCSTTTSSRRTWSAWTSASRWFRNQPGVLAKGREHTSARTPRARLPHDRRHHALAEPVYRGVLPRSAADEPDDPGNVLPDGGPACASLHALPRRRGHRGDDPADHGLYHPAHAVHRVHEEGRADARRPLRLLLWALPGYEQVGLRRTLLGCWGSFQNPEFAISPTRT